MTRVLMHFPIVHTHEDMGTLSTSVQQATIHKLGRRGTRQKSKVIDSLWTDIERKIDFLNLSYKKVRLYQDGLPVCGREIQIIDELAKAGGRNHRLLLRLMDRGAALMGTESLELLMEEYALAKGVWNLTDLPKRSRVEASRKADLNSLLKRRDQFIARRINDTLYPGETGILFLGMLHSVDDKLDGDIRVVYPLKQLFSDRGKDAVNK
jgi:hypothetical protein